MTIENAAFALVEARQHQDRAAVELAKAVEHRDAVQARILAAHQQRSELAARRSSGQEHDEFALGSKLQVIALDLESLTDDLLVKAEADVKAAQANVAGAGSQVDLLARQVLAAEDEALLDRLIPNATILANRLLESIIRMKAIHARLGHARPDWKPSAELTQAVRYMEFNGSGRRQ